MTARIYKCAKCGDEFESTWTEEDADAERHALFPSIEKADCVVVCDDCWQLLGNQ